MAAFTHGSKAVFKLADHSAVLQDISGWLSRVEIKVASDTIDITTAGAQWNNYTAIAKDVTINLEGHFDQTLGLTYIGSIFTNLGTVGQIEQRAFEYDPNGTAAGTVKITGNCLITEWVISDDLTTAAEWTATLIVPSGITLAAN